MNDRQIETPKFSAQKCPICNGFGSLSYGTKVCPGCNGRGFMTINNKTGLPGKIVREKENERQNK